MKNRTYLVIELLASFDVKERENFKHFISCKWFNSDIKINNLLKFSFKALKFASDSNEVQLSNVYNATYNTKKVKLNKNEKGAIYAKMHTLLILAQKFLMIISLDKSKHSQTELLQSELLDRSQFDVYNKYFIKTKGELIEKGYQDIDFHKHKYILNIGNLRYYHLKGDIKQISVLNELKLNLSFYYLFNILDSYMHELSLKEYTSEDIDSSIFTASISLLELPVFSDHPLIKIYLAFIKLTIEEGDTTFLVLKEELLKKSNKLSLENQINFFTTLQNFCVLQIRKGKNGYNRKLFELYSVMNQKNLLITNNEINIIKLHNIAFAGCAVNEYDWAVQMVEKYYVYLPVNLSDAGKNYNLGAIAYYQKDYQLAIDYLFHLPNIDLFHDINRRSLMIKAIYELDKDYKETTHTLFRSFEKYISENKNIPAKRKKSYKNFIRSLINLYRFKHNETKMKLKNIKQKLEDQELNSNKSWLFEKIEELES